MTYTVRFGILRDPISAITHFLGAMAAIVGLVFLILLSIDDPAKLTGVSIYGGALIALFAASSSYHFFDLGPIGNKILRRLDHVAIYLLIAGTYVPTLIIVLDGAWRITMLSIVGGLALLGALFELVWTKAPRVISVILYISLGWIVIIPGHKILPQLSLGSIFWLIGGGLAYTVGAVVYARKKPDPWPKVFGFHEIWHIFVLAGATLHYFFIVSLLEVMRTPF